MSDDPIRKLLASMPQASLTLKPPGTVAISHAVVTEVAEEAEQDLEAVEAWIAEHGGRMVRPPPGQSQGVRAGRRVAQTVPGDPYYVIPAGALKG
jgi:hypothetical protein